MDAIEKLFYELESVEQEKVEESKNKLTYLFGKTKDQWVIQGMTEYYAKTDSKRIVEVLMKVQPPHDRFIFDRLVEWFRGQNKVLALDLFGHIVRKHPTWLYKVATHPFMKDVLKLLKTEKDIIPLMNALLCIIMLLPIMPKQMTAFLQDLFDIFSHLAAWKFHNTIKLSEDQLLQLQLGLYKLFHRLYGMFPYNFMAHIRQEFVEKNTAVFTHTIRPLLETVKMHPSLLQHCKMEEERNTDRWNKMQPHDIVTECAKFSIDYYETGGQDSHQDGNLHCGGSAADVVCGLNSTLAVDFTPRSIENQLKTLHYTNLSTTPLYQLPSYIDKTATFFSPSDVIMATPPPTHTPTPTQIFTPTPYISLGGTSPPEAGIEATPETTPMKDLVAQMRQHPVNPRTVRAMWPAGPSTTSTNSQPSSPLKKDPNAFRFGDVESATSSRLIRMVNDRNQSTNFVEQPPPSKDVVALLKQQSNLLQFSPNSAVESTQEDQEVTEINRSSVGSDDERDRTATNSDENEEDGENSDEFKRVNDDEENDEENDDEDEDDDVTIRDSSPKMGRSRSRKPKVEAFGQSHVGSPCSAGGLHIPDSRTIKNFHKRIRMYSTGYGEQDASFSCGTSPADSSFFDKVVLAQASKSKASPLSTHTPLRKKEKLYKSWPSLICTSQVAKPMFGTKPATFRKNGIHVQPSTAATKDRSKKTLRPKVGEHSKSLDVQKCHSSTQTIDVCSQAHEKLLFSLLQEEMVLKQQSNLLTPKQQQPSLSSHLQVPSTPGGSVLSPHVMLDQYIELCVKKKSTEGKKIEDIHSEHIQLLNLQLQFERHRREVHAERNRRLLGESRSMANIEKQNATLNDQVQRLNSDILQLNTALNSSLRQSNSKEEEFLKELAEWKRKYTNEVEENKRLHATVETLQTRLEEETKNRKETGLEIERLRAEQLDLRNDYQQAQIQAELGHQYRADMIRLQHELIVMGEIQMKCKEKLSELHSYEARDMQMEEMHLAYSEELKELKSTLDYKISQLETLRSQHIELETQLTKRDLMFMDQKRLLKAVKEEYEEKFTALERKYEAQKAIGIKMEEHILEIYKNQTTAVNPTVSPESDKTDVAGSLDHTSPLSLSVTSSEGLSASISASLRSVPEIKNLQALVALSHQQQSTSSATVTAYMSSSNSNSNLPSSSGNFDPK